ncbi:hypothetical protein H5410_056872 [Solanum commersonii]|uniref:Uncharacterized protein n=1 Tax=Solanum commersonii TaxID=4109 RepID=A0A9J5WMI2_SOLCO|nr:hypothetical protein H5410_056872 [Solanum commersonii]
MKLRYFSPIKHTTNTGDAQLFTSYWYPVSCKTFNPIIQRTIVGLSAYIQSPGNYIKDCNYHCCTDIPRYLQSARFSPHGDLNGISKIECTNKQDTKKSFDEQVPTLTLLLRISYYRSCLWYLCESCDSLNPNNSYYIPNGRLDHVNPNYSSVHKEVELAFTDNTIIKESDHEVSTDKFFDGFLSLDDTDKLPNGAILDLICVLVSVNLLIQSANSKR